MLENNVEKLFEELRAEIKISTYLDLVKSCNMPKEDWEKHKQKLLKEFEEADKYYEEKEKKEKKPILTDEEREYLSVVISQFRKKIEYIVKSENGSDWEYIKIKVEGLDSAIFPDFPSGTLYKGMETSKEYTLEELGL